MRFFSIDPKSISELPRHKKEIFKEKDKEYFLTTEFLRPYVVAYLDQCFLQVRKKKNITLLPNHRAIHKYLDQCGFEFLTGHCPEYNDYEESLIIKLKRFNNSENVESDNAIKWIENEIFPYIEVKNKELRKHIVENIWEIIQNGIIHSNSEFGVSACGQVYPKMKYFEVAFYDSGIGIVNNVKQFLGKNHKLTDPSLIEWALQKGNSTFSNKPNAGLGLYFLRHFIKINKGNFQIISGKGFFGHINSQKEEKTTLGNIFDGTLVNIRINISDNKL